MKAINRAALGVAAFVGLSLTGAYFLPPGIDWHLTFRPAVMVMLTGGNPYTDGRVLAPFAGAPWILLLLAPFGYLPESIGRGFLFSVSLFCFGYAAWRMNAKPAALIAFLVSPVVFHCLLNSNLEFLPILGFVLPPWVGLFFLAAKPQMGSVVALLWLLQAWRRGRWREVLRVFGPVVLTTLVSFALYGWWPANTLKIMEWSRDINASLWPMSIPVGLAMIVTAYKRMDVRYAIAASPLISPYLLFHSWAGALFAVVSSTGETIAAVAGMWILVLLRSVG